MPRKYATKPKKIITVTGRKKYNKKFRKTMRMPRQMSSIPFPKVRPVMLVYKQPSTPITSNVINGTILTRFRCTSLYDLDVDNQYLDKQPLFYDQLLSVTGPYKGYKVNAWKTTITVTNLTDRALQVYFDQGTFNSITETDTVSELQNRQGVINKLITAQANSKPQLTFTSFKRLKDFAPKNTIQGAEFTGGFQTDPAVNVISTLLISNTDPSSLTTFTCTVTVTHVFYATLYNVDSLSS